MRSTLFEWNGLAIRSYGTLFLASALVSVGLLVLLLRRRHQDLSPAIDLTLLMILGYTLGAHALYALLDRSFGFLEWFSPKRLISGFWGGQIAFALLAAPYLWASRVPLRPLADALAVTWAAISVLHKLGCFLAGCCYGAPSTAPWAVVFPPESLCGLPGQPIHPTQLYDAGSALALAILLSILYLRRAGEGRLLLWWGVLYALTKFASEWSRGDGRFPAAGPVTAAMLAEIAAGVGALAILFLPAHWDRVVGAQERRAAAKAAPTGGLTRGSAFGRGFLKYVIVVVLSMAVAVALDWPPAFYAAYFSWYLALSLISAVGPFRIRLVDARGARPGIFRIWVHGVAEGVGALSVLGLFRPLLDPRSRSLGEAAAGLFRVRASAPASTSSSNPTP